MKGLRPLHASPSEQPYFFDSLKAPPEGDSSGGALLFWFFGAYPCTGAASVRTACTM